MDCSISIQSDNEFVKINVIILYASIWKHLQDIEVRDKIKVQNIYVKTVCLYNRSQNI